MYAIITREDGVWTALTFDSAEEAAAAGRSKPLRQVLRTRGNQIGSDLTGDPVVTPVTAG